MIRLAVQVAFDVAKVEDHVPRADRIGNVARSGPVVVGLRVGGVKRRIDTRIRSHSARACPHLLPCT